MGVSVKDTLRVPLLSGYSFQVLAPPTYHAAVGFPLLSLTQKDARHRVPTIFFSNNSISQLPDYQIPLEFPQSHLLFNLAAEPKYTQTPMKNFLSFTFAAVFTIAMISCGPSEEEKKADSLEVDSTAKGMQSDADRMIDSMNRADSINTANMVRVADSIRNADSLAKLKK